MTVKKRSAWSKAVSNNYKQLVKEGGGVCLNCGCKVTADELTVVGKDDALHTACFVDAVVTYENRGLLALANEWLLTDHGDLDFDNLPESVAIEVTDFEID